MKFADATNLHRKSGGAKWRDLLVPLLAAVLTQSLKPVKAEILQLVFV